jgi:signal transduction histidine kinase
MGLKIIVAFFLFQFSTTFNLVGQIIHLSEKTEIINVGDKALILEDPTGAFTIQDIQKENLQSRFRQSQSGILDFPANSSYYWIKLNLTSSSNKNFLLFIDEAKIEHADLYYPTKSMGWRVILNGTSVSNDRKEIIHNFQVYSLQKQDANVSTVYLRLNPQGLPIPLYLTSSNYFFQIYDTRFKLLFGLIVGIILCIGLNNLILFIATRNRLRLLYCFVSFFFVIYTLAFNGYGLFISDFFYAQTISSINFLNFLSQLSVLIYGHFFLQIRKKSLWLRWWWRVNIVLILFLLMFSLVQNDHHHLIILVAAISGILVLFSCLLAGIVTLYSSPLVNRPVILIYVVSYLLFLLFLTLEIGHIYFNWSYVFFIRYIELSFLCESVGLAMAQNRQWEIEKKVIESEKNEAQEENIRLVKEKNYVLEQQVNERTAELLHKTEIAEKLSENLKVQSDELRNLNDFKDRVLSILAHDLRTPLSQLQGVLGLVDKAISEDELRLAIHQIGKQMGKTVELSNNLLLWARSQMSGFQTKATELNIYEIIKNKISFFQSSADEKQITLINAVTPGIDFRSDENILNLLIHNLIYNAIKFSRAGDSITVFTNLNSNRLVIAVADTGVGMTSEEVQAVLGNAVYTRRGTANESGTGLGLKICKDLIQRINGQMQIVSEVGKGSTFYLDIPEMIVPAREKIIL